MRWNANKNPNIGLIFYKERYFGKTCISNQKNEIEIQDDFEVENKETFSLKINSYINFDINNISHSFCLKTTYPGLLVGSGYPHDTNTEGDFAIGFYFDYTTGLPVVPGSSVKGICRSLFELDQRPSKNGETEKYSGIDSMSAINFILNEMKSIYSEKHQNLIEQLTNQINEQFNKIKETKESKEHDESQLLNALKRELFGDQDHPGKDVFLDAIIDIPKTGNRPFLGDDYITPHPSPIKNPKPIQFLKVLPNVWFKFRFILTETRIKISEAKDLVLTPDFKLDFYKQILLTQGVGAKTSVGYGRLEDENRTGLARNDNSKQKTETGIPEKSVSNKINKTVEKLKEGEELIIEFNIDKPDSATFVALDDKNQETTIEAPLVRNKPPESGLYKAKISNIEGKGEKRKFKVAIIDFKKLT